MGRKLSLLERALVFIVSFIVVIAVLSHFRIWQLGLQNYFIRAEKWLELVFLFALVSGLTTVFIYLLQWEYRVEAKLKPRRKK